MEYDGMEYDFIPSKNIHIPKPHFASHHSC